MGKPVPEREAAKIAGERFYFTGKPCKNGHVSKRYTGTGSCSACASINSLRCMAKQPWHPNRIAAKERGDRHYSTGIPCKHGHDKRLTSNGQCLPCSVRKSKKWKISTNYDEAQYKRKYRKANPEKQPEVDRRYRAKHPEKVKATLARWKRENPERARMLGRVGSANRRARKATNGGTFTIADIEALHSRQNGACAVCLSTEALEIDHILPILLGGSSDPSNLQLLCQPCNRSKGSKHPDVWRAELALKQPPLPK